MSEWKSIESAPTEGKHFLVWCPEIGCTFDVCRFAGDPTFWIWGASNRSLTAAFSVSPTHWRPLPSPPEAPHVD